MMDTDLDIADRSAHEAWERVGKLTRRLAEIREELLRRAEFHETQRIHFGWHSTAQELRKFANAMDEDVPWYLKIEERPNDS